MVCRSLAAFVVVALGLVEASPAQDSSAPAAAGPGSSANTQSKSASEATPRTSSGDTPASLSKSRTKARSEQATFGAGCFWHVEDVFERLKGVNSAVSGYAGGGVPYPSYEMVHEGITGHAEVVMVDFDPDVISYENLLRVFWKSHNPTSINRQGEDEGPQYRSVIFYHSEDQRRAALKSYRELTDKRVYRSPIVTQLVPMRAFYQAEDYHQDYYGGKPKVSARRRRTTVSKSKKSATKAAPTVPRFQAAKPDPAPTSPDPKPVSGSTAPRDDET
jgi:peptide-methionine (S)-S-oxide reductase